MRYAGLTDEPKRRKQDHGNPGDFRVMQQFTCETAARVLNITKDKDPQINLRANH